jgi:hypothetical protein
MSNIKVAALISCLTLQGCGEKFYEQRPFDVSKSGQIFRSGFIVEREYDYRIALIFDWENPNDLDAQKAQEKITGAPRHKGVPLPLLLKIYRNGEIFADNAIQTDSLSQYEGFCYNQKTLKNDPFPGFFERFSTSRKCSDKPDRKDVWGPSRTIDIRTLPPGRYLVEIQTIMSIEEFSDMDAYIEVAPYAPKI